MRPFLAVLALFALLSTPAMAARPLPEAKLLAVYFYADWCPNCKALSPIMGEVRSDGELQKAPVLFVTMDLTDKPRIQQSLYLATALGIGDYLRAQGSATGYVALLDAKTKKEVARFDRTSKPGDILARIQAALNN
jgi:thiol-disulfide isomerase/thioredoxin